MPINDNSEQLAKIAGEYAAKMLLAEEGYCAYWSNGMKMNKFAEYFDTMRKQGQDFYGWNLNGYDWCDVAFDWAVCKAFGIGLGKVITYQSGGGSAYTPTSAQYYINNGAYIYKGRGTPRAGDQIFYTDNGTTSGIYHTGMVYAVDGSNVYTIEGNIGGRPGRVGKCTHSLYSGSIHGYGRPNYAHEQVLVKLLSNSLGGFDISDYIQDPTLSQELLESKTRGVENIIEKLETAINNYNSGKCTEQKLAYARSAYERAKSSFQEYMAKQKERKVTNYEELEKIYKILTDHKFPEISELAHVEALGSSEWFDTLISSYNSIIDNFNMKITSIIQGIESEVLNKADNLNITELEKIHQIIDECVKKLVKEDYKEGDKIVFKPQVLLPEKEPYPIGARYLWKKMFTPAGVKVDGDFSSYTSDEQYFVNKKVSYDTLCFEGLRQLLMFCNTEITVCTEVLNFALQNKDFEEVIQQNVNLLQLEIFKLYAVTFGDISREVEKSTSEIENGDSEIEEEVVYKYIKKGPCYNFGGSNEKYNTFCKQAKNAIFGNKLYLTGIDVTNILTDIAEMLYIKKVQIDEEVNMKDAIMRHEASYKQYLKDKKESLKNSEEIVYVDWRELIYQMAQDYYNYAHNPTTQDKYQEFLLKKNNNIMGLPESELNKVGHEFRGYTGYEVFYTDILGFWRQLYFNPILENENYELENNVIGYSQLDYNPITNWYKQVLIDPSKLNFWFDLTEGSGELGNYTIHEVGDRLKATKDGNIRSLYYKDAPEIILYEQDDLKDVKNLENNGINSFTYFQIGGPLLDAYSISSQGRAALDLLQEQLYKFAYCVENVTITTLPVYTLKPNYRVMVQSHIHGLSGEYIVSKYSIPLVYNGTMSITATKAVPYIGINT